MGIGKGSERIISLDLLGAIAGALKMSGNAPVILAEVRKLIAQDEDEVKRLKEDSLRFEWVALNWLRNQVDGERDV